MDLIVFILVEIDPDLSAVARFFFIRSTSSLLYYVNRFTSLEYLYIP